MFSLINEHRDYMKWLMAKKTQVTIKAWLLIETLENINFWLKLIKSHLQWLSR